LKITDATRLEYCTDLYYLYLHVNQTSDILPLASFPMPRGFHICDNQISDTNPLVQNEGVGTRDLADLQVNAPNPGSVKIYVPQPEARGANADY
jgi:hypothetical protein